MNESWAFWLALIGAGAWVPQIIFWFHNWFAKPKLNFVPEDKTEIGYTSFGPILNQFFAISTSRKDALIERIKLEVVHESGAKYNFLWKFLDERGPEITGPGGTLEQRKRQSATALKISILGLCEKKIGFQDILYQEKGIELTNPYREKLAYFIRTAPTNYQEEILKSNEFLKVLDFIKNEFYWKVGKYVVNLFAFEVSLKQPHKEQFEFRLSQNDVEQLERNIIGTQESLKDEVLFSKIMI